MASSIAASTSGGGGLISTADASGNLNLVSGTTTIVAMTSAGIAVTGTASVSGASTFAAGTALLPALTTTGDTNTGVWFPAADTVAASTAGTERMRIDSSGNVGIGTSSPNQRLEVANASTNTTFSTTGNQLQIRNSGSTVNAFARMDFAFDVSNNPTASIAATVSNYGTGATDLLFGTFNTGSGVIAERMRISTTGVVTMAAYGAGTATFSAAGVISSVSDETWKIKDGVPVDPDSMLKKLEPGYWYYNDEKKEIFGTDRQLGFYAQNVNAAIGTEAAPAPEDGKPWGYYDRSVLAVTVMSLQKALAAIQELKAIIDTQAAQITALNAKVGM